MNSKALAIYSTSVLMFIAAGPLGCGKPEQPPLAVVTGTVTYYGEPARAEIIFQPLSSDGDNAGRPSTAHTREDGSFRLQYNPRRRGAVIAPHHVTIKILRPLMTKSAKTFQEASQPIKEVHLQRTVKEKGNHYVFAITK